MLMSCLDAYISTYYGDFCANDNDDDNNNTTDYFTPCACARGNENYLYGRSLCKKYNMIKDYAHGMHINYANRNP